MLGRVADLSSASFDNPYDLDATRFQTLSLYVPQLGQPAARAFGA